MVKDLIAASLFILLSANCFAQVTGHGDFAGLADVITNFSEVVPSEVYRGARPDAQGIEALAKAGIKTIVDLQGADLNTLRFMGLLADAVPFVEPGETEGWRHEERVLSWRGNRIHFHNIPLDSLDVVTPAENKKIDRILEIMHDPKNQPVFVHCEHGKDRTGLIIALYRLRYQNYTIKEAHDEMVKMGHRGILDWFFTGKLDRYFYKQADRILKEKYRYHWASPSCPELLK